MLPHPDTIIPFQLSDAAPVIRDHALQLGHSVLSSLVSFGSTLPATLASYLETPPPQQASPEKHTIWFFDGVAWKDGPAAKGSASDQAGWMTECAAAYFSSQSGSLLAMVSSELIGQFGPGYLMPHVPSEDFDAETFRNTISQRLRPFLTSISRSVSVPIKISSAKYDYAFLDSRTASFPHHAAILGPSSNDGISKNIVTFPNQIVSKDAQLVRVQAEVPDLIAQPGLIRPVEPEGWGIVSDLDDVIDSPRRRSPLETVRATLAEPFTATPGMPALFNRLDSVLGRPAVWYVSSYPYNLYPSLRTFRDANGFPFGPLLLRESSWMNFSGNISNLVYSLSSLVSPNPSEIVKGLYSIFSAHSNPYQIGVRTHKLNRLRDIRNRFPSRRMILIGDSCRSDPEVYGDLFRESPEWVAMIFIRYSHHRSAASGGGGRNGRSGRASPRRGRRLNPQSHAGSSPPSGSELVAVPTAAATAAAMHSRRNESRFQKAFRDVPAHKWILFDEPEEILGCVQELVAQSPR